MTNTTGVFTEAPAPSRAPASTVPVCQAAERHYTTREVATMWHLNITTVRRLFEDAPGVVVLQAPAGNGKRAYRTLRIPQSVLDRLHKRLQVGGQRG
jgi:hypothetical protein